MGEIAELVHKFPWTGYQYFHHPMIVNNRIPIIFAILCLCCVYAQVSILKTASITTFSKLVNIRTGASTNDSVFIPTYSSPNTTIEKITLQNFYRQKQFTITDFHNVTSSILAGKYIYFGSDSSQKILRFHSETFASSFVQLPHANLSNNPLLLKDQTYLYVISWQTGTSSISRIDLSTFAYVDTFSYSGTIVGGAIVGSFGMFAINTSPTTVLRLALDQFPTYTTLQLTSGDVDAVAVYSVEQDSQNAYFVHSNIIVQVQASPLQRVSAKGVSSCTSTLVTLPDQAWIICSAIEQIYSTAATFPSPGTSYGRSLIRPFRFGVQRGE